MHYVRNISLPGDPYTVTMGVRLPAETEVAFHESWREAHGTPLFEAKTLTCEHLDLAAVAAATRRKTTRACIQDIHSICIPLSRISLNSGVD